MFWKIFIKVLVLFSNWAEAKMLELMISENSIKRFSSILMDKTLLLSKNKSVSIFLPFFPCAPLVWFTGKTCFRPRSKNLQAVLSLTRSWQQNQIFEIYNFNFQENKPTFSLSLFLFLPFWFYSFYMDHELNRVWVFSPFPLFFLSFSFFVAEHCKWMTIFIFSLLP